MNSSTCKYYSRKNSDSKNVYERLYEDSERRKSIPAKNKFKNKYLKDSNDRNSQADWIIFKTFNSEFNEAYKAIINVRR